RSRSPAAVALKANAMTLTDQPWWQKRPQHAGEPSRIPARGLARDFLPGCCVANEAEMPRIVANHRHQLEQRFVDAAQLLGYHLVPNLAPVRSPRQIRHAMSALTSFRFACSFRFSPFTGWGSARVRTG
ncbi:MAG TPA: hypothetical protein VGQ69_11700, partial [Gemmatimonadales bacterium]|nr:hypothetical protein [Gemmatimonadales bacterium]